MGAGGDTALLLGILDYEKINLLGLWHSNEIIMFLHTTNCPLLQFFARIMVYHGNYAQIPTRADLDN